VAQPLSGGRLIELRHSTFRYLTHHNPQACGKLNQCEEIYLISIPLPNCVGEKYFH
jgi:hypothetical protein